MGDVHGKMGDVDREALTRIVYQHLSNRRFSERLVARAADGTRPILVSVPDDRLEPLIHDVMAVGGAANVALPYLNGFVVFALTVDADRSDIAPRLATDCTVGLFFARLRSDGEHAAYRFVLENADHTDAGCAEMVAVAD